MVPLLRDDGWLDFDFDLLKVMEVSLLVLAGVQGEEHQLVLTEQYVMLWGYAFVGSLLAPGGWLLLSF